MSIEQIRHYQPPTQAMVERSEEHLARRQALWARLDQLLGLTSKLETGKLLS
jgi:hypothetical protein